MFKRTSSASVDISAETFAKYNQALYYKDTCHQDSFVPFENPAPVKVTV